MSAQKTFFYQTLACLYIFSVCSWLIPVAPVSYPLVATKALVSPYLRNGTMILNYTVQTGPDDNVIQTICGMVATPHPIVSVWATNPTDNTQSVNKSEFRSITYLNVLFTFAFVLFMMSTLFKMARVEKLNNMLKFFLTINLSLMLICLFLRLIFLNGNPAALSYSGLSYDLQGKICSLNNNSKINCNSTYHTFDSAQTFAQLASEHNNEMFYSWFDVCVVDGMRGGSALAMSATYTMNLILYISTAIVGGLFFFIRSLDYEEVSSYEQTY